LVSMGRWFPGITDRILAKAADASDKTAKP